MPAGRSTYLGSCHCGAIRFEIDAVIDHVRSCDCSVCRKRGALILRVPEADFRLLTPADEAFVYRWGSMTGADYICRTCGIMPFRRPSQPTTKERERGIEPFDGWAINTRCLENFEPGSVPVRKINGSAILLIDK